MGSRILQPALLTGLLLVMVWLGSALPVPTAQAAETLLIGVLAKRGSEETVRRWTPTAEYLNESIPGTRFSIVPLPFDAVQPAIQTGSVDFILVNPALYVALEAQGSASRIVTLRNRGPTGQGYTRFGGVVFTRRNRSDLTGLADLQGERLGAVEEHSLGGYLAALRELRRRGIELADLGALEFLDTHDAVVLAVLEGRLDAGTVRTDTLERMAAEGKIDIADVRVIEPQFHEGFDFRVSTPLYPEWPLASVPGHCNGICDQVAAALLQMPADSPAAKASELTGWTVPGNYQSVHDLLRELQVGPYANPPQVSLAEQAGRYAPWLLAILAAVLLLAFGNTLATVRARNRTAALASDVGRLRASNERLERERRNWNDIFDAIGDPVFVHDEKLNIVQANEAYIRAAGMSFEEMSGRPYYDIFPRLGRPLAACRAFPEVVGREPEEITLPSGEVLVSRSFGIRRADGSYTNAVHFFTNCTGEQNVLARWRMLGQAVEQGSEGMVICDLDLVILYANRSVESLLEAASGSLSGKPITDLVNPAQRERLASVLEGVEADGRWSGELEFRGRDGRSVEVYVGAGAIRDDQGVPNGFVLTVVDIGARRESRAGPA